MRDRAADRRMGRLTVLARACLFLYALFVCAAQFEHHDLACELKTPQHCTACSSSVVSANPSIAISSDWCQLSDVGGAVPVTVTRHNLLLVVRSNGRSPPDSL